MRVPPATYLGYTMAGCVVAALLLVAGQASPAVVWVGTLLFGLCMACVFPTAIAVAEAHFPVEVGRGGARAATAPLNPSLRSRRRPSPGRASTRRSS